MKPHKQPRSGRFERLTQLRPTALPGDIYHAGSCMAQADNEIRDYCEMRLRLAADLDQQEIITTLPLDASRAAKPCEYVNRTAMSNIAGERASGSLSSLL